MINSIVFYFDVRLHIHAYSPYLPLVNVTQPLGTGGWGEWVIKACHKNLIAYFYPTHVNKQTLTHADANLSVTDHIFRRGERIITPKYPANNGSSWHKQDSLFEKMLILHIVHSITGEVTGL